MVISRDLFRINLHIENRELPRIFPFDLLSAHIFFISTWLTIMLYLSIFLTLEYDPSHIEPWRAHAIRACVISNIPLTWTWVKSSRWPASSR
jgi:hypothetical protein